MPTREDDWASASELVFSMRRKGTTVPFTDALIAALAVRHGAILLHADRDFDLIAALGALQVESMAREIGSAS